jgi:hypothetical protein
VPFSTKVNGFEKPVKWFEGNEKKNKFIKEGKKMNAHIKKGLFVAKEMGDVLQVLIMFIWAKLHPSESYVMVTTDKVVMLLCMMLQVNCLLTNASATATTVTKANQTRRKKQEAATGVKLRHMQLFEPNSDSIEKARERFVKAKEATLEHNAAFTLAVEELQRGAKTLVKDGVPYKLSDTVYTMLLGDMRKIQEKLKVQAVPATTVITEVDQATEALLPTYKLEIFFRPAAKSMPDAYIMTLVKTFTRREPSDIVFETHQIKRKDMSFYEWGRTVASPEAPKKGPSYEAMIPNKRVRRMPAWLERTRGGGNVLEVLEYPEVAMFTTSEGREVNLYDELTWQVRYYLRRYPQLFDHVYSTLLHTFSIEHKVLYDAELGKAVQAILADVSVRRAKTQKKTKPAATQNKDAARRPATKAQKNATQKKHTLRIVAPKTADKTVVPRPPLAPRNVTHKVNIFKGKRPREEEEEQPEEIPPQPTLLGKRNKPELYVIPGLTPTQPVPKPIGRGMHDKENSFRETNYQRQLAFS